MKENFESFKPDTDMQLGIIEDSLVEMREQGDVTDEELQQFRTTKEMVSLMEDEKSKEKEKSVLLEQYRKLIRSKKGLEED